MDWKTLLVVGALTIGGTFSLPHKPLPYDKAVELGVAIYNSKAAENFLYRLLEAVPQPEWVRTLCFRSTMDLILSCLESLKSRPIRSGKESRKVTEKERPTHQLRTSKDPNSESTQVLKFTMKETVCPVKSEHSLEECDFQEDGEVRQCRSYYFFEERPPVIVVICAPVARLEEKKREEEEKEEEGKEVEDKQEEKKEEEGKGQPRRVKRFKKFFKKIKNGIKTFIKKTQMVISSHFRW